MTTTDKRTLGDRLVDFMGEVACSVADSPPLWCSAVALEGELTHVEKYDDGTETRVMVLPVRCEPGTLDRVEGVYVQTGDASTRTTVLAEANLKPPQPPAWVTKLAELIVNGEAEIPSRFDHIEFYSDCSGGYFVLLHGEKFEFHWDERMFGNKPHLVDTPMAELHSLQPVRELVERMRAEQQTEKTND